MGEAYTEQDLRRAESLLNDSSIGSTDEGGFATDEAKRCLAAEFAAVRREIINDPCGRLLGRPMAEIQAALIYYDKRRERDQVAEKLVEVVRDVLSLAQFGLWAGRESNIKKAEKVLAEWERGKV